MQASKIAPMKSTERRTFRFAQPGQQARLAVAILITTLVFGVLAVGNSYAAYSSFFDLAMSTAPVVVGEDLQEQTRHYVRVTSTLAAAYALTVLALSMIFVGRIVGPVIAIERHARALRAGDYSSRIGLRSGHSVYADVAMQLNDLAKQLERGAVPEEARRAA